MKHRVYTINDKVLVKGDVNEVTENEILVTENKDTISLSTRVNGKLKELAGSGCNVLLAYPLDVVGKNSVTKILSLNSETAKIENFVNIVYVNDAHTNTIIVASSAPSMNVYNNCKELHNNLWTTPGYITQSCKLGNTTTGTNKKVTYEDFFKPNVEESDVYEGLYKNAETTRQIMYPLDETTHIVPAMIWYTSASNVFRKDNNNNIIITRDNINGTVDDSYLHYIFYVTASATDLTFGSKDATAPSRVIVCPLFDTAFNLSTIDGTPTLTAYAKVNMQKFRDFFKLPSTYKNKYSIGDRVPLEIQ